MGAVCGNYCSKAVGNWLLTAHPDCWKEVGEVDDFALAAAGTSPTLLGHCRFNLSLTKENNVDQHLLLNIDMTVLDISIDIIIGRPTVRENRPYISYLYTSAFPQRRALRRRRSTPPQLSDRLAMRGEHCLTLRGSPPKLSDSEAGTRITQLLYYRSNSTPRGRHYSARWRHRRKSER
jgi:hypothetical protein